MELSQTQDLGILTSLDVTYTYIYLFNPSLIAMAEEINSNRSQEVSITVENPDSAPLKKTNFKEKEEIRVCCSAEPPLSIQGVQI